MKILIIQTAFIGDVVLATSIIENISMEYKDAQIDFLLRKGNETLLKDHPKLNHLLIWDKKKRRLQNLFKILKKIRSKKYDYIINLQRFGSTGFLTFFSGANKKLGFSENPFSFAYTNKVKHGFEFGEHEIERNNRLIGTCFPVRTKKPKLYVPKDTQDNIQKNYSGSPYVVIAPASVWYTKQLPHDKWIELINTLDKSMRIFLIGASEDYQQCQRITEHSQRGVNLCGKLSLIQSVGLIKSAKMIFVNDSAPTHFASAVNTPCCSFFCSTLPEFGFTPLSDISYIIQINKKIACRPCGLHGKKKCPQKHFQCGNDISINQMKPVFKNLMK